MFLCLTDGIDVILGFIEKPVHFKQATHVSNRLFSFVKTAFSEVLDHIDEKTIREVLPKAQVLLKANDSNVQLQHIVLRLVDKLVANLERSEILDEILPLLVSSKLSDPIVLRPTLRKSLSLERTSFWIREL